MKPSFHAKNFPQLAAFVRAYLHEDFKLEHSTPEGALDDFKRHATPKEWSDLKSDFRNFMTAIEHVPFTKAQEWWTRELGSAWLPAEKSLLVKLQQRCDTVDTK